MKDRYIKCKSVTPRDAEYIKAYIETHSQTKAAAICGVSRETIARAVRRANIPLTGRKYNTGQNNGQLKITDDEIIEESKRLTALEIAHKYDISPENLSKRAKKLGVKLDWAKSNVGRWKTRAQFYGVKVFDTSITLEKLRERDNDICQICGGVVDDKDIKDRHIRKKYPTLDHIIPLSKGGAHSWDNIQLAHMSCNAGKCDRNTYTG